jgi:hypothetical protein
MNIIIQALIDAKNTLELFRQRCNAQEWEKVSAQIAHLNYLATTTEVVAHGDFISDVRLGQPSERVAYEDPLADTKADPRAITEEKLGHPSEAYIGRDGKHAIRWIPEAPGHPGLYAYESKNPMEKRNCTHSVHDALQFMFKQQCIDWCERHPVPKFVPMEHAFMGDC